MKKSAFTTMTLLFLLVGFTHANVIASTSQAFTISSSAVMSYPETLSGWIKTITWSDETKETIQITDKGKILLNGIEKKAFGFSFLGWLSIPDAALETILDWMDSKGVRFVDIYFNTDVGGLTSKMDFYFPKFYSHKKFVRLIIAPEYIEGFSASSISLWKTEFDQLIDHIDTDNWSDIVYAIEVTHEHALAATILGKTVAELSANLDQYYNYAANKLSTSQVGLVPIIHAECIWDNPSDPTRRNYWKTTLAKTDIILLDFYPPYLSDLASTKTEVRNLASQVGKARVDGYQHWHEFGRHKPETTRPHYIPVDFLTTLLNQTDTGDAFLFYVYERWDPDPDIPTWYFATDGSAEYWTEVLTPHFPH